MSNFRAAFAVEDSADAMADAGAAGCGVRNATARRRRKICREGSSGLASDEGARGDGLVAAGVMRMRLHEDGCEATATAAAAGGGGVVDGLGSNFA